MHSYTQSHVGPNGLQAQLESTAMMQYLMHRGVKVFGQPGVTAVLSKLKQLNDKKVIAPCDAKSLTVEQNGYS